MMKALDQERKGKTRAAAVVVALAAWLNLNPENYEPKRGRPRAVALTTGQSALLSLAPAPLTHLSEPTTYLEPRADRVEVVDWRVATSQLKAKFDYAGAVRKTLYVAADKTFVRWHDAEVDSSTGRALTAILKKAKQRWSPETGWSVAGPKTLEKLQDKAIEAGWRTCDAAILTAPQCLPITAIRCGSDAWTLVIDRREWQNLLAEGRAAHLERALKSLAERTEYCWIYDPADRDRLICAPRTWSAIEKICDDLGKNGYEVVCKKKTSRAQLKKRSTPVIATTGNLVSVSLDLMNPLHLVLAEDEIKAVRRGGFISSKMKLPTSQWRDLAEKFRSMGGLIEEAAASTRFARDFDRGNVPGWSVPAANGLKLFEHQKIGVAFLVERSMRAIVGDEMGLGKTAESICAACAVGANRMLAIVPVNARYVWEREIRGWIGDDTPVVHVFDALSEVELPERGWVIVTYDLLIARAESWQPISMQEADILNRRLKKTEQPILRANSCRSNVSEEKSNALKSIRLNPEPGIGALLQDIDLHDDDRNELLRRVGRRLSSELFDRLEKWDPDVIFVDEAHRIKNAAAARTAAVRKILSDETRGAVLITGTPLRNHAGDGGALIEAVFPDAVKSLGNHKAKGFWREARLQARNDAIGSLLGQFMIRRLKKDVLDLPPKIRQSVDVMLSGDFSDGHDGLLAEARDKLRAQIKEGKTIEQARASVLPILARAKHYLGCAKVESGVVADLIDAIVEEKSACVVFVVHRDVSDILEKQLGAKRRSVVVVDGSTAPKERAEAERGFQAGEFDVFIGGIHAAGEAITLTRADTCMFVELDWTPAAMLQAEDRGHRAGQEAKGYHVITVIGRPEQGGLSLDEQIAMMLQEKLANINATLGENERLIGDPADKRNLFYCIAAELLEKGELKMAEDNAAKRASPVDGAQHAETWDIPIDTKPVDRPRRRVKREKIN